MGRYFATGLALLVGCGLTMAIGGCSSGCGHCHEDTSCEAEWCEEEECDTCSHEEVCHEAPARCNECGRSLQVWYACPHCEFVSSWPGACIHCGAPLEQRHAQTVVSPEGSLGSRSSSPGDGGWGAQLAAQESQVTEQRAAAVRQAPAGSKSFKPVSSEKKVVTAGD